LSAFLPYYKYANKKLDIAMDEFIKGIYETTTPRSYGSSVLTNADTVWLEKELNAVIQNTNQFNKTAQTQIENIPTVIKTDQFFEKFKEFTMNREVLLKNGKLNSLCSDAPFEVISKLNIVNSFRFPLEFNKATWPCVSTSNTSNGASRGGALYTKIGKAKLWVDGGRSSPMLRTVYNKGKSMYIRNKNNSFSRVFKKQFA
jgi:hypothetical protein